MSYNYLTPSEAFEKDSVKFKGKQISSDYSEEEQSRISGKFVLAVIALIILEVSIYQIFPFNQTFAIIATMLLVFIGYFFMNAYLTTYQYIGTILFTKSQLEFSNKDYNQRSQIDYTDIVQIKGKAGIPHQVFRGKNQKEEFMSLKITFVLSDEKEFSCEICTKLDLVLVEPDVTVHHMPHLEALLQELFVSYKVIDKKAYKNDRDWAFK